MEEIATLLNLNEDASGFRYLRNKRIGFFRDTYIDRDTQKTVFSVFEPSRKGSLCDTQVSYALPIAMGIHDTPGFRNNFAATVSGEHSADDGTFCPPYSLMTGFIGTAWILEALSIVGRNDLAYRLLTSTEYPSWLYPVTQGATTIWERLDSYTHTRGFGKNNSMNSFNHYSFGSVGDWLLTRSAGLRKKHASSLVIEPEPDPTGSIKDVSGWLDTDKGRAVSEWHISNNTITYIADIPEGENARMVLKGTVGGILDENNKPASGFTPSEADKNKVFIDIPAGRHVLKTTLSTICN